MLTRFFDILRDKGEAQERYDAGALLFARGDEVESLYFLEHGEIKLSRTSASGRELVLHR
ncbi:MAG: cyclic nucleotide-binding domain-containing protein, partial [bacterium]|nr:cyclic nucleotide-binding domain-containing protein [bacterium]